MFTGLVETQAQCHTLHRTGQTAELILHAPAPWCQAQQTTSPLAIGESIAVNGCCLTLTAQETQGLLHFDLLAETLDRTNLGTLQPGEQVNLERALQVGSRLGGHFVQGHIDQVTPLLAIEARNTDRYLTFALPAEAAPYVVPKGSIALNGVSLTIATLEANQFGICLIPLTLKETNLGKLAVGNPVNVEFDILGKYVQRNKLN